MSLRLGLAGAAFVLCGVTAGTVAQEAKTPKIELSQPGWDFGKVWHLERPVFMLEVRNAGMAELRIDAVRTTCGCTVAQPERKLVPPGDRRTMSPETAVSAATLPPPPLFPLL